MVLVPEREREQGGGGGGRGGGHLKDFRLISLVRCLYKLLAKVLVNQHKKVVGNLVLNF